MTNEQIKALIEAQLNNAGWQVAEDGKCTATEKSDK